MVSPRMRNSTRLGVKPHDDGKVDLTYTVTYNTRSLMSVMFQRRGSDWPRLLPYCLFNTALMATLHLLKEFWGVDLWKSGEGHNFLSFLLSFLLISRVTTSLSRYCEAREYLRVMNQNCAELVNIAVVLSWPDSSQEAKEWRHEIAYRTMLVVRTAMEVLDYPTTGIKAIDLPEVGGDVLRDLRENLPPSRWLHQSHTDYEENLRIPTRIAYLLRKSIRSQQTRLHPPLPSELDLYICLNGMLDGFYGIVKLTTTPVPFPLIQMSSTLLYFYLFTVPFVLLPDGEATVLNLVTDCITIFLITYGFMGLELVSIQLDDPFGNDENDFNNLAWAQSTFEDVYVTMKDIDGEAAADKLRLKMQGNSGDPNPTERSGLLNSLP